MSSYRILLLYPPEALHTVAAASNVIWLCFGFVFFLFCLTKDVWLVLVGGEPVGGGAFCLVPSVFCLCVRLFLVCFWFACRISRRA